MELFDVYDSNRNLLGYSKARGDKLLDNEYNMGIETWIINDHKLLMTKRSLEKSHPGKWEVPGGCSQIGESSIDTLTRELKEEVNIDIKDNYKLLDTVMYKKMFVDIYTSNIKVDLDKVSLQKEEVSDIKFFTKEEFLNMKDEIVESVFNRYEVIKDKLEDFK